MNATDVRPEVASFVARVRDHLDDLTEDERDELLGGLEADLSEQLAEGGTLPDPVAYAAELRAAAGLPDARPRRLKVSLPAMPTRERIVAWPDLLRSQWFELTEHDDRTRQAWMVLEAVRPAWWVLRAWVAVTLLDQMAGDWEHVTLLPTLGLPLLGPALLAAAVVVSVLIGLGRLWPGSGTDRPMPHRLVLATLNIVAVVVPLTFTLPSQHDDVYYGGSGYQAGYHDGSHRLGLRNGADVVRNIYAYDAAGQPVVGIQLFDQLGRPVAVSPASSMGSGQDRSVTCPWFNGSTALFNVFPLPQRAQRWGDCLREVDPAKVGEPALHAPPLASVPPVALPDDTATGPDQP